MNPPTLSALIDGAPLVVCLGPGGVGKTTVSSVLALHRAAAGARALVLTIDPARRLADALGVVGLTNDPIEVTAYQRLHPKGTLAALMLDPGNTFDHLITMLVTDPARRERLLQNRFYQHLSRSLIGTLEYMAVERLHELVRAGTYDGIVLDTPPTTNALDFLEAPEKLANFFSERIVKAFAPAKAGGWASRLLSTASSATLGLLSRVAGEAFVSETVDFFEAFADLFGSFRARGLEVGRLLRDPKSVFLIVLGPDPGRLAEAQEIDRRLAEAGCPARAFIVNRVDQAFLPGQAELAETVARATALLGGPGEAERVRLFLERLEALRQSQESSTAAHARIVAELRAYAGARPVFIAPGVPSGQSPRASLLAIYVGLFASDAAPAALEEHAPVAPAPNHPHRRASDANGSTSA
jgi:anion-transporting  ArsA/GET3 family ATPase